MAITKNANPATRTQHVVLVASAYAGAMATDSALTPVQKAGLIGINAASHWLIDSFRLPKALDQGLHLAIAILSALFI